MNGFSRLYWLLHSIVSESRMDFNRSRNMPLRIAIRCQKNKKNAPCGAAERLKIDIR